MKCQICGQDDATVQVVNTFAGHQQELLLCPACAEANKIVMQSLQGMDIDKLVQETAEQLTQAFDGLLISNPNNKKCDQCGITYEEFVRTGKLGCPHDYEVFANELKQVGKHIHGSTKHVGKCPSGASITQQLRLLNEKLSKAVETENYEEAASLRDQIKTLQQKEE